MSGSTVSSSGYNPDELFLRAREGDQEAWTQLVDHCYDKVRRVVRRKLDRPMRSLFDSTDFTNDVFKSLVAKSDRFDFPNMAALKAYLEQAAQQKLIDEYRRQHRQKRDLNRQQHLPVNDEGVTYEPPSSEPTPSQYAVGHETREAILAQLDETKRKVLELKQQGYSTQDIAEKTGLEVRTIQRLIKKASESWFLREGRQP